ncbi:MAG: carboxypeptidase-like regulatory domain-containing protein [Acidobacteriota bacterium]
MRLLLILLATSAVAQNLEIRGTVIERGPNTGLAGVQVTLTEFVQNGDTLDPKLFANIFTDAGGRFSFKPTHFGDFRLDIQKAGYMAGDRDSIIEFVVLTSERAAQEFRFGLMQPASLTGRVVDEKDQPVANLQLMITGPETAQINRGGIEITTGADGSFTAKNVSPGAYLVRVSPGAADWNNAIMDFSEDDFKVVDEDFETTYWPGGVTDARSALPLNVAPGSPANIGTIRVRRVKYYRTHVSVAGPCPAGQKWEFTVRRKEDTGRPVLSTSVPCRKELIIKNLRSGSYDLFLWSRRYSNDGRPERDSIWAATPLEIRDENSKAALTIAPGIDLTGRVIAAEGSKVPVLKNIRVMLRVEAAGGVVGEGAEIDLDGNLFVPSLPFERYRVSLMSPPSHYVKEVRYGGVLVTDGRFTLVKGASFEFVLDEHPASIVGTITRNDKPVPAAALYVVKLPQEAQAVQWEGNSPWSYFVPVREGQFQLGGLAPGEYRIGAIPLELTLPTSEAELRHRIATEGQRITLQRGEQKVVQLKASDPAR